MKLLKLEADDYRSLHKESVALGDLNLFIGANASGKSTVLDALRFLHDGVQARDFHGPVYTRGGIINLAWKGDEADSIRLCVHVHDGDHTYEWSIRLVREGYEFHVEEHVHDIQDGRPLSTLLTANGGDGWWWSGEQGRVELKQAQTTCALAAAAADASFPARSVAEFVTRWGFFDPSPFLLRRDWTGLDSTQFDPYGRNLGTTLFALHRTSPEVLERIVDATRAIVGLPAEIEPRESDDRFFFIQREPGLQFPVHQMGASSGTLRILALMTALLAEPNANLIGIEEPENYVHPSALSAFVEHINNARGRVQFMVTTHSPLLLDYVDEPATVRVVRRQEKGTTVDEATDPEGIRNALEASGFTLGQFYESKGFGAN